MAEHNPEDTEGTGKETYQEKLTTYTCLGG